MQIRVLQIRKDDKKEFNFKEKSKIIKISKLRTIILYHFRYVLLVLVTFSSTIIVSNGILHTRTYVCRLKSYSHCTCFSFIIINFKRC